MVCAQINFRMLELQVQRVVEAGLQVQLEPVTALGEVIAKHTPKRTWIGCLANARSKRARQLLVSC